MMSLSETYMYLNTVTLTSLDFRKVGFVHFSTKKLYYFKYLK